MCGFVGWIAPDGQVPSVSLGQLVRMGELLKHRGPDGQGSWAHENAALVHQRLAIRHPGPEGAQPRLSSCGRYALVYNGELYNEPELRAELEGLGFRFTTHCDTEVVLAALIAWRRRALERLRGMFAIGFWDSVEKTLLLARDPLGMKPLYYAWNRGELVFASEIPPLLTLPDLGVNPDWGMVSAYLSTVRSVLGTRTLFEGVSTLEPGTWREWNARSHRSSEGRFHVGPTQGQKPRSNDEVRAVVEDSVRRHLVSDRPLAAFLSGGLDSSVICEVARRERPQLATFCAAGQGQEGPDEDVSMAAIVARHLGTEHVDVPLDGERFGRDWAEMVARLGVPLSTPNEVAIWGLSRAVAAAGFPVVLSGEGADELLGGYELSLQAAWQHLRGAVPWRPAVSTSSRLRLDRLAVQTALAGARHLRRRRQDGFLFEHYSRCSRAARKGWASVPIRSPRTCGSCAARTCPACCSASTPRRCSLRSKAHAPGQCGRFRRLRRSLAHAAEVRAGYRRRGWCVGGRGQRQTRPAQSLARPPAARDRAAPQKHSFPVPFQEWMASQSALLSGSRFGREVFQPDLLEAVAADPPSIGASLAVAEPGPVGRAALGVESGGHAPGPHPHPATPARRHDRTRPGPGRHGDRHAPRGGSAAAANPLRGFHQTVRYRLAQRAAAKRVSARTTST
ncbi:MAG: asparagine synthase (glutamine-hydrolyzing) [Planctomycetota bacterium]